MKTTPMSLCRGVGAAALMFAAGGCDDDGATGEAFTLRFAAIVDGQTVGCNDTLTGFGPGGTDRVAINDIRFYVSNLRFLDADGEPVKVTLDDNEFQYRAATGAVALVDLTGNTEGSCASSDGEGTARVNAVVTGTTELARVRSVAFDVGVPQPLMQATIAGFSAEGAPSPLDEMYWSWNSGYRHVVFNFAITDADDVEGGGFVHFGSRDCGPEGGKALEDRDACTFVNTPSVRIDGFDPATDTVGFDLRAVLADLTFRAPIVDPDTREVIGDEPGVVCHSSPRNPDCAVLFESFGVSIDDGSADARGDTAFVRAP